ncbi:PREDICTED: UPF0764 protein C16orf89 homolog [Hipposideros armiger]|uniref:UPF0764 protein C16orf89 homolog n=1 Tax=Hipposideros armiger TaxID=186990 RepID=A0A8B7SUK6_HIPAR|nr:PREDICTED: UPF0764 protein C16orf89 homolog [Hipposideros armiger]
MSSMGLPLLLLLLAPPLWPFSLPPPDTPEGKATITGLILSVLEKATSFLKKRLPEINLDGVVGFRVLEAHLRGVQEEWAQDPQLQPLSLRMGTLQRKLAPLLHRSIVYLKLSDPEYLREFQPTTQPGFWKLPHVWTHINASMVYPTLEPQDSFSEEQSDMCLVQLLGTRTDGSQPCRLSDFCRTLMTKLGCSGYCLSHQLLFFLIARMKGCTRGLFHQSQRYMNLFCAKMMDLNRRAEAIGYAYPTRDIFMENIMFCGIGGFSDFYQLQWLEAILSWQKPQEGCFGRPDAEDEKLPKDIHHQQHYRIREKRREKQFADGCSSHNTATAVAALGGFLYALVQYPLANGELRQATPVPPTATDMNGSTPAIHQEDKTQAFGPSF